MRLFLILCFCLPLAFGARAEPLTIVTEQLPPFNYLEDGEAKGMSTEVLQATMKVAGENAEIDFLPWARSYQLSLSRPNTLIYSIIRTPDREDQFAWVGEIAPYGVSLYKRSDNSTINLKSLSDAKELTVGVYLGDAKAEVLQKHGIEKLDAVEDDRLNLRKLLLGRIDLMVIDDTVISQLLKDEGVDPSRVKRALPIQELSGYCYMAFQKDSDPALVKTFQKALAEIKSDGTYNDIIAKYVLIN
ncbi:substrate-binding periplasmic protein [Roseibium sp. M-1]